MLKETDLTFTGLPDDIDMFKNELFISNRQEESDEGEPIFVAELNHKSLGLTQSFREDSENILTFKAQQLLNQWMQAWKQLHTINSRLDKIRQIQNNWKTLLSSSLEKKHIVDLDQLKNKEPFEHSGIYTELQSKLNGLIIPERPLQGFIPSKPVYNEPDISFSQKLLFQKRKILNAYEMEYDKKFETWQKICERIEKNHQTKLTEYEESVNKIKLQQQELLSEIETARQAYEENRLRKNEVTDILQINYNSKHPEAVEQYFNLVLLQSEYPEFFPKQSNLEYHRENQTLFLSLELPHPNLLPKEKELPFNALDNKEQISYYSDPELNDLYNDIIYKILLRTFHEIFSADHAQTVEALSVSGWVRTLNRGNGQYENVNIVSLFATRTEFEKINLRQIDPTLCFRFLQGVSSPVLAQLSPIPTPFTIRKKAKEEPVASKNIEPIDNSTNLANMAWFEFEKQMIELLEKEFGTGNGEIEIMHSAMDSGLEACGQDPDPIRGGKIIFTAKRSIKPIPVAAVRELFGSVIHEGAFKGILITTTDFTPEAYEFAKNKPLRLLNGSNLLTLFEKHGKQMRINLREAVSLETWLS